MRLLFLMFVTPVCVIPFKTGMAKNQEYLRYHEITIFKRKKFSKLVYARGQVSHGFLKRKKKQGGSILIFLVCVFVDTILIIFEVNITLVQVYVAIRVSFSFLYFIYVHFDFDYPIEFGP